jgi:amidohydrolase
MFSSDDIAEAIGWRHQLHGDPETAFEEFKTSAFIAERLAEWQLQVRTGYGRTGVVGTLSMGTSTRSIAIRADIDALGIREATGLPYASRNTGKMHACGHDGHTAMLLLAARQTAKLGGFDGTVHFVFQPAEENEGGAKAMISDGLFRDLKPDAVFALHNWPNVDVGCCAVHDGDVMAAYAVFAIQVHGSGAHAAMPHQGNDPIVAAANIVTALQTIASRSISPLEPMVVSVTQIDAGDTWNVIADRCVIRGTARWFAEGVGKQIEQRLAELSGNIARAFGCRAEIEYQYRYPATVNHPAEAALVREVVRGSPLDLQVVDQPPSMAAEDFSFMLQQRPGCYFWLGARRDGENPGLHSPRFDFNDAILPLGAEVWTRLVSRALDPKAV